MEKSFELGVNHSIGLSTCNLYAGEKIDMPVFFYIDPEFATDDRLKSINHLTLSYTFFNVDEEEVDLDGEVVPASALIGRERASTAQTAAAG